jgi:hypothetical protein
MARALIAMGPVRSLRRLSKVHKFGRRRRSNLRFVLNNAVLESHLTALLTTMTDTEPDTPPVVKQHPLGPDADFPALVAARLLAVPFVSPDPAPRPGFPSDHPRIVSVRGALRLPRRPDRVVIIGGDYAGTELAMAWRARGSDITILHSRRHLLAGNLPVTAEAIHDEAVASGIVVFTDVEILGWAERDRALSVTADTWDGVLAIIGDIIVLAD